MPIRQHLSSLTHLGETAFEKLNRPTAPIHTVLQVIGISRDFLNDAVDMLEIAPAGGPYSTADILAISALKRHQDLKKSTNPAS